MRNFVIIFVFLMVSSMMMAQGPEPLSKGKMAVNVGTGFWGLRTGFMPIHAGMEFGITEDISVGYNAGWRLYSDGWNHSLFVFQARGDYHFNTLLNLDKVWDVYAGLRIGPAVMTAPANYPDWLSKQGFNFTVDGYAGGRWYFSDTMALNAEVGLMGLFPDIVGPTPFINAGLTFRLN